MHSTAYRQRIDYERSRKLIAATSWLSWLRVDRAKCKTSDDLVARIGFAHYNLFIDGELNTQMIRGKRWAYDIVR